jgi:DinB superfamily
LPKFVDHQPLMLVTYTPKDGFPYYLQLAGKTNALSLFQDPANFSFLDSISEKRSVLRYAPDKWSIKQVVGHMTDHERIKIFRAFMLSRKSDVELWGYDQESLVRNSRFDELPFKELLADYRNVRRASLSFIESLSPQQLSIPGKARGFEVLLEDFLKTIIGHEVHHLNILKEKYL